jgi:hypothetical protein
MNDPRGDSIHTLDQLTKAINAGSRVVAEHINGSYVMGTVKNLRTVNGRQIADFEDRSGWSQPLVIRARDPNNIQFSLDDKYDLASLSLAKGGRRKTRRVLRRKRTVKRLRRRM